MKNQRENRDKKRDIIHRYDSSSHFYDDRYRRLQQEKYKIVLEDFAFKEKKILDAGCGTGLLFDFIILHIVRENSMKYIYVGIDISIEMLKNFELKLNTRSKSVRRRITLLLADLENLPIRNEVFDSVFSLTSFQNLPDIAVGINECLRVVKNMADLKISILKKKLCIDELLFLLKPKISDLEIINKENIEDLIVQGKVLKD